MVPGAHLEVLVPVGWRRRFGLPAHCRGLVTPTTLWGASRFEVGDRITARGGERSPVGMSWVGLGSLVLPAKGESQRAWGNMLKNRQMHRGVLCRLEELGFAQV